MKGTDKRIGRRRGAVGGQRDQERIAANLIRRLADVLERRSATLEETDRIAIRLEPLADEVVAQLERMLASGDAIQQRQAVGVARELCDDRLVELLHRALHDPHFPGGLRLSVVHALTQLAAPLDEATFLECVVGPIALLHSGKTALQADPAYLVLIHDMLTWVMEYEAGPLASYLRQQLVPRAERAMLPLLTALVYHPDDDVAMAAIEGLERVKEPALLPLLEERVRYDSSPEVRRAAEKAALRLAARTSGQPPQPWLAPPSLPVYTCYLRTIDGDGGQALFVTLGTPDVQLLTTDYIYNDHQGLTDCVQIPLSKALLNALMDHFQPARFAEVSLEVARAEVEWALKRTLEAGRRPPPAYNVWRRWLEGDDPRQVEAIPLPLLSPEEQSRSLRASGELLLIDEFDSWIFPPQLMEPYLPRYERLMRRNQMRVGHRLREMLLDRVVTDVVAEDSPYRRLLPERLRRQAWLLMQIYGEGGARPALSALAAAAALEQGVVREHPFLRAMALESLDQAWSYSEEELEGDELDDDEDGEYERGR